MNVRSALRRIAAVGASAVLALSLASCSNETSPTADAAEGVTKLKVGQWKSGPIATTALTTLLLSENEEVEQRNGIDVEFVEYSNLQALYTDVATGRIDAVVGGPESMASSAAQGAPISLAGSFSRSNAAILATEATELTADSLRGKRLVAPTSTSTWQLVRQQIEDLTGLKAEKDYELVTSETSGAAIQQLAAGTADFAMAWGEPLVEGLDRFDNVQVIADHNALAGGGKPFIQFVVAVNSENVDPETGKRLLAAYADQVVWMGENLEKVDAKGVENGRLEGTSRTMVESGLMNFDVKAFPSPESEELMTGLQEGVDAGTLAKMPPTSFILGEE